MKNILAVANVPETFGQEFSIYNLVEFLGAISLTEKPDFNFNESSLTIADADTSLTYFYASEGMVTTVDKMITMPDSEINIDLSSFLFFGSRFNIRIWFFVSLNSISSKSKNEVPAI